MSAPGHQRAAAPLRPAPRHDGPLVLIRAILILFVVVEPGDATDILVVPEILWEASLGLYPLIKGFRMPTARSPTTGRQDARRDPHRRDHRLTMNHGRATPSRRPAPVDRQKRIQKAEAVAVRARRPSEPGGAGAERFGPLPSTGAPPVIPVIGEYLSELTTRLERQLADRLVAAWLIGSGALGDFDPGRSDVDVQAVSTTRLRRSELQRLAAALRHEALPCPVRGLEFVLYAREDLSNPRGPAFQLNLNTGPGMGHHAGYDAAAEPRFWFVLDVMIARQHARPLAGPSPDTVLPALSRPLVLSALQDSLDWYRTHDSGQAVIAACRLGVGD